MLLRTLFPARSCIISYTNREQTFNSACHPTSPTIPLCWLDAGKFKEPVIHRDDRLTFRFQTSLAVSQLARNRACQERPPQSPPLHKPGLGLSCMGHATVRAILRCRCQRQQECPRPECQQSRAVGASGGGADLYRWRSGNYLSNHTYKKVSNENAGFLTALRCGSSKYNNKQ